MVWKMRETATTGGKDGIGYMPIMKSNWPRRSKWVARGMAVLFVLPGWSGQAAVTEAAGLDRAAIREAAANASSLVLTKEERLEAVETFIDLVQIKGPSGREEKIRDELRRRVRMLGGVEVALKKRGANAPLNLVMEIPATGNLTNAPGLLLNAHIDTIASSNPERMAFEASTGDFFHLDDGVPGKSSSFGGDDRAGVAVIVEAARVLHDRFWTKDVSHRRIVLLFTADEERGLVGAKYLAREEAEVFAGLSASIAMDGPIELRSNYPKDSFVLVVAKTNEVVEPYQKIIKLVREFCDQTETSFGLTEVGLGSGDFAAFPAEARAGLHIRSPVRGWHQRERVKVQDLIGHMDLVSFLVLNWDQAVPRELAPEPVGDTDD